MTKKNEEEKYTKYEIARMLGGRSLQIAMGAPFLVKLSKEELEKINYNPIEIAKLELKEGVMPISVKRPKPKSSVNKNARSDTADAQ